jgi:RNA polymerase sigma-70 factor (ECF subfamily)
MRSEPSQDSKSEPDDSAQDSTSAMPVVDDTTYLVQAAAAGDGRAVDELFTRYRDRLARMVRLRISQRLQARVDASDVLQESLIDAARHLAEYARNPAIPFYLWLRNIAGIKLAELHRRHLGTQRRDAGREVSLHRGGVPAVSSASLAGQLIGHATSPSDVAIKEELRLAVQEALNSMDPIDREVIALKHFEQLSISEIAQVTGLSKAGAAAATCGPSSG